MREEEIRYSAGGKRERRRRRERGDDGRRGERLKEGEDGGGEKVRNEEGWMVMRREGRE